MTKLRYEDYGDDIEPDDVDRAQDAEEDARSRVYYEDCLEQMYEPLYLHDDDLDLGDIDEDNTYVARLISSNLPAQPSEGG